MDIIYVIEVADYSRHRALRFWTAIELEYLKKNVLLLTTQLIEMNKAIILMQ